jgi:hypothetical protein
MKPKFFKIMTIVLSICILQSACPKLTYAEWKGKEPNLPGTMSSSDGTAYVLTALGGAAIIIGVAALIGKSIDKNKKKKEDNKLGYWGANKSCNYTFLRPTTLLNEFEQTRLRIPVDLYVLPASLSNTFVFQSAKGLEVGIKIRF